MEAEATHHRESLQMPQTLTTSVKELLEWRNANYDCEDFSKSGAIGKGAIRRTFSPAEDNPDAPKKLTRILDFLAARMKMDDGGQLKAMLDRAKGMERTSVIPLNKRREPNEVLRKLLVGEYDKNIEQSGISRRGEFYTVALYLYMNTSTDSEKEMAGVLSRLIAQYDDPKVSRYDMAGLEGLGIEPFLADMCTEAVVRKGLHERVRTRTQAILDESTPANEIGKINLFEVMSPIESDT